MTACAGMPHYITIANQGEIEGEPIYMCWLENLFQKVESPPLGSFTLIFFMSGKEPMADASNTLNWHEMQWGETIWRKTR